MTIFKRKYIHGNIEQNTSHYTTTLLISMYVFPLEDGHKTETCSGYWIKILFLENTPHYTTTLLISMYIFPLEDGHKTETCSGYWIKIQTSVALDGNPESDLVHATGCKQPTFKKHELQLEEFSLLTNVNKLLYLHPIRRFWFNLFIVIYNILSL
jgi:hypothetical protein